LCVDNVVGNSSSIYLFFALCFLGGSASLFRLKAEKEWDLEQEAFTSNLFSLDLQNLEKAVACIPLFKQLELREEEIDVRPVGREKLLSLLAISSILIFSPTP
jgi:hypothetical protein